MRIQLLYLVLELSEPHPHLTDPFAGLFSWLAVYRVFLSRGYKGYLEPVSVTAGTECTPLVGQTAWLQRQHGSPDPVL